MKIQNNDEKNKDYHNNNNDNVNKDIENQNEL